MASTSTVVVTGSVWDGGDQSSSACVTISYSSSGVPLWTNRLLCKVAAWATGGDVCRSVETIESRPGSDRKELDAIIFADRLQNSRIDWHRAVETEARSFQDDF